MTTRRWMNMLCGPSDRPRVATPFRVTVDGKEWDCATNGKALLLVSGPVYETREDMPDVRGIIPARWSSVERFSYEALRDWCAPERCESCSGHGLTDGETAEDERPCPNCNGSGWEDQLDGFLMGYPLNRRLLFDFILPVQAASVHVHVAGDEEPLLIKAESDTWRVYLMGMVRHRVSEDAPKFPDISLAEPAQTDAGGS